MSFQTSSRVSNQSEGSKTGLKSKKSKPTRGKPTVKKDQDLPLKLPVAAALARSGYYTRINIALSATSKHRLSDVTDVDVLALRHDIGFNQDVVVISCKSGRSKGLSLAREIFYLRGVLDYIRADKGIVASLQKPVPVHLRDLGTALNILALSGKEVEKWCESITNGLPDPKYFQESTYEEYLKA